MEIDRLELAIQAEATKASSELDKLIGKLNILSNSLNSINTGSFKDMSSGLRQFEFAVKEIANIKTSDFTRLTKNISKLAELNHSGLTLSANALSDLTNSLDKIGSVSDDAAKVSDIAKNISKLGNVSMQRTIDNLPRLSVALKDFMTTLSTAPNVSSNLINMTNAMANLASYGSKYNSTINSMSRAANTLSKANNNVSTSTKNMSSSVVFSLSRLVALAYSVKRAFDYVGNSIERSMDFTETINLFQTSFKKIGMETAQDLGMEWGSEAADQFAIGFIEGAQNFNEVLTDALSLDPNITMNYQALFAQMANAFGLASDSVINLSSSFTMLGLDLASLFNMDIDTAMTKLRSGLAGEAEPLRTLGIDITQTTLQMTALKYGIDDSVTSMNMASKTQLRWLAIMDQAEIAFGDMAKTVESPSNQLRILEQQWNNLSRSIGNVFLPIVSTVLPYINAVVIAIRRLVDVLATSVGFELPDYSNSDIYTDITGGIEGIGESADDATNSTNKLKKALLGIDELNILSEGATSKKNNTGEGSGYLELDDAIKNKTGSYMAKFSDELAKMSNKAEELADKIQPKLEKFIEWIDKLTPAFAGAASAFATYKIITWFSDLASKIGLLSLGPAGVIALAIGALAAIVVAIHKEYDRLVEKDISKRFGDIVLSMEDIKEIAEILTTSKYTTNIDIFVTEHAKLSEIEKNIEQNIAKLNKYNWKVSVGIGLTPDEQEDYKTTIESFIQSSQNYIQQKQYVVNLALTATITNNESFLTEMQTLVNEYFDGSRSEMETLGRKLRSTMDEALADGILDEKEQKVIMNLQKEINEITQRIADSEFQAKLQMLSIEYGSVDITADSFKKLASEIQSLTQERIDNAEESYRTVLTTINASYKVKMKNATSLAERKQLQSDWDADIKTYTDEFSKTKATITLEGLTFSMDVLTEKYSEELAKISPYLKDSTNEILSKDVLKEIENMDPSTAMGILSNAMFENYQDALAQSGISGVSKKGLKELLKGFEPTEEELQKIYDDALESGSKIPEGVSDALTDIKTLQALAGDLDAIAYLMGEKLSTDPNYLDALSKSNTAGIDLSEYFIQGLKSKIPDLKKQGDQLVFDVDKAIKTATENSGKKNMPGYADNMSSGMVKGFNDNVSVKNSVTGMLNTVNTTISNWKLPNLTVGINVDTSGLDRLSNYGINISTPGTNLDKLFPGTIKGYAGGGMPEPANLYYAHENGMSEFIGRIGNNPVVANNDQIVQAVKGGVVDGVMEALVPVLVNMSGGGSEIIVENIWYSGDEKLYQATQRGKAKAGRRFQTVNEPI